MIKGNQILQVDIRKLHTSPCNIFPKYYPFDRHACFWTVMYTNINHKSNVSSFTYSPMTNQYHGEWNILGAFVLYSGLILNFSIIILYLLPLEIITKDLMCDYMMRCLNICILECKHLKQGWISLKLAA